MDNVYVLAGLPNVMQAMMNAVAAGLQHGPSIHAVTLSYGLGEGVIAKGLAEIAEQYQGVDIGSYPSFRHNKIGVSLVARGTDKAAVVAAAEAVKALIIAHGGKPEVETTV